MQIPTKICQSCGNTFCKKPNESQKYWGSKKYCSSKCSLLYTTVRKQKNSFAPSLGVVAWNKGTRGIMKPNATSFKKGNIPWTKGRKRPEMTGEKNPTWKPKTERTCFICHKVMQLAPWEAKRKFCSLRCRGLGKRDVNSPVYKGENGSKRIRVRIMDMPEYVQWRKTVFYRDNFTCVKCNQRGGVIEADHIHSLAKLLKENGIKTPQQARLCPAIWDVTNGRTLCRKCHRMTDSYPKNLIIN